jgi:hypothetical protein
LCSYSKSIAKLVAELHPSETGLWIHSQLVSGASLLGLLSILDVCTLELEKDPRSFLMLYQQLLTLISGAEKEKNEELLIALVRCAALCVKSVESDVNAVLPLLQVVLTYPYNDRHTRFVLLAQMSKIALLVPDMVLSLSDKLEQASSKLTQSERCHVTEALFVAVACCKSLGSPSDASIGQNSTLNPRETFVRRLMDPVLQDFQEAARISLSDLNSFIRICDPNTPEMRECRSRIMLPMVTFNAVFKRANNSSFPAVLDQYVVPLAEKVMQVVQLAHQLTDPALAKNSPLVKMLQETPFHVKQTYLQGW